MKRIFICLFQLSALYSFSQGIDKSYQNYDFVRGENVLFEDMPESSAASLNKSLWQVNEGAASVINFEKQNCISIDAYYTKLQPLLFNNKMLPDSFSIEYDTWLDEGYDGNPGIEIHLLKGEAEIIITPNKHQTTVSCPESENASKDNPEEYFGENKFYNRWVHISISQFQKHLKVYLDQYPMIDIADCKLQPDEVLVTGNMSQDMKILLKNFRIATSFPKALNLENGKFITHAIQFDVDQYKLKPESITIIKQIYKYLKEHENERFEIGGHTDNDGSVEHNNTLSQNRAESVRSELISMGIPGNRLEAKGYGSTKPISNQNTREVKALNRRVELTRL